MSLEQPIGVYWETRSFQFLDQLKLPCLMRVEFDVDESTDIRWQLNTRRVHGRYAVPAQGAKEVPQFKYDILSSARLCDACALTLVVCS